MHATLRAGFTAIAICCASFACTRTVVVSESHAGEAGEPGWQPLGSRTVHGRNDHDTIKVGSTGTQVSKLRFEVKGSALEMYNVVVVFGNGSKFSPDTRLVFSKGEESRVIDLPGETRNIKEIKFHYGNLPRGGKAHVKIFAR